MAIWNSRRPTWWIILLCVGILGGVPGCQMIYRYEIRGKIRSSSDKTPLGGVLVTLRLTDGSSKTDALTADTNGSFNLLYNASDDEFFPSKKPKWSLVLTKDGFADEIIDISPTQIPDGGTNQIVVVVDMTPSS